MSGSDHVPDGWPALIPRLFADDPAQLVDFIQHVFCATGSFQADRPTELRIEDSILMVGSTLEREAMPAFLYVYVADTDATHRKAVEAGATALEEPLDTPYGDRRSMIRDAWGNTWQIATHSGTFTP